MQVQAQRPTTLSAPKAKSTSNFREVWRKSLTMDRFPDPIDAVVEELSDYFKMSREEVVRHCINWEDESLKEWQAKDRSTPESIADFYQTQVSWIFDTMWYHANQYHGQQNPESIWVAERLRDKKPGHHLDYGSGPGSSSLFFQNLGWQVSLADISKTMLDFSRWRFARHNVPATFYHTLNDRLPDETFDLITAFDVVVHIPDVAETFRQLHRALKPGGYFIFNIDNQPRTDRTAWHLYTQHYPIIRHVRRTGFQKQPRLNYFYVYQKVDRSPIQAKLVDIYDGLRYNHVVNTLGNIGRGMYHRFT